MTQITHLILAGIGAPRTRSEKDKTLSNAAIVAGRQHRYQIIFNRQEINPEFRQPRFIAQTIAKQIQTFFRDTLPPSLIPIHELIRSSIADRESGICAAVGTRCAGLNGRDEKGRCAAHVCAGWRHDRSPDARAVPEDALPRCHGMKSGLDDLPGSGSQRR